MSEKQVRDYDKFMLRLPEGMRDAIADRAQKNGRSMNSEIVQILEDALIAQGTNGEPAYVDIPDKQLESMVKTMTEVLTDEIMKKFTVIRKDKSKDE